MFGVGVGVVAVVVPEGFAGTIEVVGAGGVAEAGAGVFVVRFLDPTVVVMEAMIAAATVGSARARRRPHLRCQHG